MEFSYTKKMYHVYVVIALISIPLLCYLVSYITIFYNANITMAELGATSYILEYVNVKSEFVGSGGMGGEVTNMIFHPSFFRFLDENGKSVISNTNCEPYFAFNGLVHNLVNFVNSISAFTLGGLLVCLAYAILTKCHFIYIVANIAAVCFTYYNVTSLSQVNYLLSFIFVLIAIVVNILYLVHIIKEKDSKKNKNIVVRLMA